MARRLDINWTYDDCSLKPGWVWIVRILYFVISSRNHVRTLALLRRPELALYTFYFVHILFDIFLDRISVFDIPSNSFYSLYIIFLS